jgi:hypothetical protein
MNSIRSRTHTKMSEIRSTAHNNGLGSASSIFFSFYIESVSPDNLQKLHQQGMRILAPDRIKALAEHLPLIKVRTENIRFFKDQNKEKYIIEDSTRYCPARWIWLKVGSFDRSSFKSEARRFS